ncbi:MAG: hypothetical protein ACI9FU_001800, partial [Granulosicoccus sp.]
MVNPSSVSPSGPMKSGCIEDKRVNLHPLFSIQFCFAKPLEL